MFSDHVTYIFNSSDIECVYSIFGKKTDKKVRRMESLSSAETLDLLHNRVSLICAD